MPVRLFSCMSGDHLLALLHTTFASLGALQLLAGSVTPNAKVVAAQIECCAHPVSSCKQCHEDDFRCVRKKRARPTPGVETRQVARISSARENLRSSPFCVRRSPPIRVVKRAEAQASAPHFFCNGFYPAAFASTEMSAFVRA